MILIPNPQWHDAFLEEFGAWSNLFTYSPNLALRFAPRILDETTLAEEDATLTGSSTEEPRCWDRSKLLERTDILRFYRVAEDDQRVYTDYVHKTETLSRLVHEDQVDKSVLEDAKKSHPKDDDHPQDEDYYNTGVIVHSDVGIKEVPITEKIYLAMQSEKMARRRDTYRELHEHIERLRSNHFSHTIEFSGKFFLNPGEGDDDADVPSAEQMLRFHVLSAEMWRLHHGHINADVLFLNLKALGDYICGSGIQFILNVLTHCLSLMQQPPVTSSEKSDPSEVQVMLEKTNSYLANKLRMKSIRVDNWDHFHWKVDDSDWLMIEAMFADSSV